MGASARRTVRASAAPSSPRRRAPRRLGLRHDRRRGKAPPPQAVFGDPDSASEAIAALARLHVARRSKAQGRRARALAAVVAAPSRRTSMRGAWPCDKATRSPSVDRRRSARLPRRRKASCATSSAACDRPSRRRHFGADRRKKARVRAVEVGGRIQGRSLSHGQTEKRPSIRTRRVRRPRCFVDGLRGWDSPALPSMRRRDGLSQRACRMGPEEGG